MSSEPASVPSSCAYVTRAMYASWKTCTAWVVWNMHGIGVVRADRGDRQLSAASAAAGTAAAVVVVVATGGNADGRGEQRAQQRETAS